MKKLLLSVTLIMAGCGGGTSTSTDLAGNNNLTPTASLMKTASLIVSCTTNAPAGNAPQLTINGAIFNPHTTGVIPSLGGMQGSNAANTSTLLASDFGLTPVSTGVGVDPNPPISSSGTVGGTAAVGVDANGAAISVDIYGSQVSWGGPSGFPTPGTLTSGTYNVSITVTSGDARCALAGMNSDGTAIAAKWIGVNGLSGNLGGGSMLPTGVSSSGSITIY